MIQRVYEAAKTSKFLDRIIIATDDVRIFEAAEDFGAEVRMTSTDHLSGTERVAEVAKEIQSSIIINIQGDEPLLIGEMINDLVVALQDESIPMATLAAEINNSSILYEKNVVKVTTDKEGFALNFFRSPLSLKESDFFFQHIGIYGYQKDFLQIFCKIAPSKLEKQENLEQLRALENGYKIKIIKSQFLTLSVDIPQDIIKVENYLKQNTND